MIGEYTKDYCFDDGFCKILRMMSNFSSSIGDFHTLQSLSLSEELQKKYDEFNTKINQCKGEFKQESLKLFEEVSDLVSHFKSKQLVLEKLVRDKEELNNQEIKSEPSSKNNQNDENGIELMKTKISNEIGRLEASLLKKAEIIEDKQK